MTIPLQDQNIIAILGIETLPDERKAFIVEQVTELVQKRLLLKILDSLDPQQQAELGRLLEGNDKEAVQAFIEKHVPNMTDLLAGEISAVKEEAKGWVDDILKE